jgi:DNA polymerase-3 subunit gamma/tau
MERARVPSRRGTKNGSTTPDAEAAAVGGDEAVRAVSEPYTVVARRYRPQRFEEVVGQDHVVRALRNAIRLNRIAQAYLFCGTRGVGKTTMARILSKCLNCVKGPTEEPCQVCDICRAISQGQDVDVIEIDGASNNGVEQVRELRQNAGLRPSRARFKVYYIDEVHMLSTGAFNALLKTLEEPPSHVKFIFATTEANKIPDTVLSRCQRYDLTGITPQLIVKTLAEICEHEKVAADPEALHVVARRAAGSLRDAESLLERLLASGSLRLTVEVVQGLLGTASDERLLAILEALADHDAAGALRLLDQAADQGVQPVEVLDGLLEFLRDALVLAIGADSILLAITPRQKPRLEAVIERFPIDAIYTAFQILDQHRMRLRGSLHGRLLVEMALVRVARLEDLESLDAVIERLASLDAGGPPVRRPETRTAKKKGARVEARGSASVSGPAVVGSQPPSSALSPLEHHGTADGRDAREPSDVISQGTANPPNSERGDSPAPARSGPSLGRSGRESRAGSMRRTTSAAPAASEPAPLDLERAQQVWPEVVARIPATLAWRLSHVDPVEVIGPDVLVIAPQPGYNAINETIVSAETLEVLRTTIQRLIHRPVEVRFQPSSGSDAGLQDGREPEPRRANALSADPLVQKVIELFEARPVQMHYDGAEADPSA